MDTFGYEVTIQTVLASRRPGKYSEDYTHWDSVRKYRTAYANIEPLHKQIAILSSLVRTKEKRHLSLKMIVRPIGTAGLLLDANIALAPKQSIVHCFVVDLFETNTTQDN
jgi:hypothetical protein